jgi:hypothetical protein
MIRPVSIRPQPGYRVWVAFSDGVEGIVDLSDLVGQGVFEAWKNEAFFNIVHLGPGRQIRWSDDIELCPDALYLRLTGKAPEELFPALSREPEHARG